MLAAAQKETPEDFLRFLRNLEESEHDFTHQLKHHYRKKFTQLKILLC
jgi:hypothetical protein